MVTAMVWAHGVIAMAPDVGTGAEVRRPAGTVVIYEMVSMTALTSRKLPLL